MGRVHQTIQRLASDSRFETADLNDGLVYLQKMLATLRRLARREIAESRCAQFAREALEDLGEPVDQYPVVPDSEVPVDEIHFVYKDGTRTKFRMI